MFRFNRTAFLVTIALLFIEVMIALFVRDSFVRPYIGDLLVAVLIYCFFRSFVRVSVPVLASSVLLLCWTVEILQLFHLVEKLGLSPYPIARVVIGTSFSTGDMIAYAAGIAVVVAVEKVADFYSSGIEK